MPQLQQTVHRGTVTWRGAPVRVTARFTTLLPEPTGHLDCRQQFPVGMGMPLRLDDERGTLVVIVGPDNHFLAVRPLE